MQQETDKSFTPCASICPLSCVRAGTAVRICQLQAAPEVSDRLREIGFCENQTLKLVASHANFICQLANARLAISSVVAESILVQPLTAGRAF